jgi:transposase
MKPYPLELRQRIVEAVERQYGTIAEAADLFNVTERYVYKLCNLHLVAGDIAPRPHGGGAPAKLDEKKLRTLAELIAETPDATRSQLRDGLRRRCRVTVCTNTVWRAVQRLELTLKKRGAALAKPTRKSARPSARSN